MLDHARIEQIVEVLRDSVLTEMEVRQGDALLRLRRPPKAAARPAPTPVTDLGAAEPPGGEAVTLAAAPAVTPVKSGLVGIFHALPDPVAAGDLVSERQVLGHVESMRLMNDCLATATGEISAVLVEDNQPVEYGQTLFEIREEEGDPA